MRFTHHTWVKVASGPSKAQRIPYRRGDIPYIYVYSYTIIYNHISYIVCKWGFVDPFTKLDAPPSRTFQNLNLRAPCIHLPPESLVVMFRSPSTIIRLPMSHLSSKRPQNLCPIFKHAICRAPARNHPETPKAAGGIRFFITFKN